MKFVYSSVMMMMALGLKNLLGFFLLEHLIFSSSVAALPFNFVEQLTWDDITKARNPKLRQSEADSSAMTIQKSSASQALGASTDKADAKDAKVSDSKTDDSVESLYVRSKEFMFA